MTSSETEGSSPWMPNGGSSGHRSPSARDSWTPGRDCICYFGVLYRIQLYVQYARNNICFERFLISESNLGVPLSFSLPG